MAGSNTRSVSGRNASPSRSLGGRSSRPAASRASSSSTSNFFAGGLGGASRGIFGASNGGSSYYKRRPRDGYIQYLIHKLQRMIKELWAYARKNPMKAFFAVVVPLLSAGGAVHGLLKQFGVRIPMIDGGSRRGGGGYYGSSGYGGGSGGEAGGWMNQAGSLISVAKMFM
ncbi:uncharacterized protein K489DRAFT_387764 [Dissoconium aciculare CBS 342.82]|uniref:Uncharacterized protein n=1 Tax=Dissoconium aciculare CBS 342.82 TaxID=1314786 RepID=A0A6J3M819_9PEZI|nr:uncharacterized protein K489DRAFT_387764 [Dissoconium aciculare CBS 342.82]KAF1824206.1 hypothetical protein K489DRAFT_387764 [Dissoconium aciculare CBS 342.82]